MDAVQEFPYLVIYWDDEIKAVVLRWRGGYTGRNLKEGLNAGLTELRRRLATVRNAQWIGDTTDIGVIGQEEQDWIDKVWFPAFLSTGVRHMVVVQPQSAVAKLSVKGIMSKVPGTKLTVYTCSTLEDGRAWIKQQKL